MTNHRLHRGFLQQSFRPQRLVSSGLLLAGLFGASLAQASASFPDALQDAAGTDCTPACITCHLTEPGVIGNAQQPFALDMVEAGLEAGEDDTVAPAYDIVFLEQEDPALPEEEKLDLDFPCAAEVLYGCGAHVAPQAPSRQWPVPLFIAAVVLLIARRRIFSREVS